jgi:hypothetical protein
MAFCPKSISPWWGLPILASVLLLPLSPVPREACACYTPSIDSVMSDLLKEQRNYFIDRGHFAPDIKALEEYGYRFPRSPRSMERSHFKMAMDVMTDRVITYSILKEELPSDFLGIGIWKIYMPNTIRAIAKPKVKNPDDYDFAQIICYSDRNSLTKPNPPSYDGVKFTCPEGFNNPYTSSTN